MPLEPKDFAGDAEHERVTDLLSSLTSDDFERHEPPAGLWSDIATRIGDDLDAASSVQTLQVVEPPPALESVPAAFESGSGVSSLDQRRKVRSARSSKTPMLVAAAAVIVALIAGAAVLVRSGPSEQLVASATLEQQEPLGSLSASAQLVEGSDGEVRLVIDAADMPPAPEGESYELWLIDADVTDPLSLGEVTGSGEIVVPTTIDPATHPVVDISLEPNDGDEAHSGHSLMRGTLN